MQTTSCSMFVALLVCLSLLGCGKNDTAPTADPANEPTTLLGKAAKSATDSAREELAKSNIDLDASGYPKAEITPTGDLLIDGKAVAVKRVPMICSDTCLVNWPDRAVISTVRLARLPPTPMVPVTVPAVPVVMPDTATVARLSTLIVTGMPETVLRLASTAVTVAVTESVPELERDGALRLIDKSEAVAVPGGAGTAPPNGLLPTSPPPAPQATIAMVKAMVRTR